MPPSFSSSSSSDRSFVLATGFGTTAAMWTVGYVCRLPAVMSPSATVLALMLAALLAGGFVAGRLTGAGFLAGAATGALSSILNLLILGSLLGGSSAGRIVPGALWWVPGSILTGILVAGLAALAGTRTAPPPATAPDWTAGFAKVAAATTLLLLAVGGLVTSADAGLSVVDWPRSYGYNMFLYPLSRMTGGIYYEHAHRLFGSLVGLTTLVLAAHLHAVEGRRFVKRLSLLAVALVIAQGVLGGLRVTGKFTLAASPEATEPNIYLAVVHGVLAQVFFGVLVSIAVFTSRAWKSTPAGTAEAAGPDRTLSVILAGFLLVQLALGAALRHLNSALLVHAGLGVGILPLAVFCGTRALDPAYRGSALRFHGWLLIQLAFAQVALGFAALVATRLLPQEPVPGGLSLVVATAHQVTGAALLGSAVAFTLWNHRFRAPAHAGVRPAGVSVT